MTEPPDEMYGKTLRIPDEQIAPWYSLLLGEEPPAGAGPRDAKRALARALVTRFHSAAAAAEAEAGFDRVFIAHELPEEIEEAEVAAAERHRPPAGGDRRGVRPLALRGAADARPGRRAARRRAAGGRRRSTCRRRELDGRVLQLGKRHFRRLRVV